MTARADQIAAFLIAAGWGTAQRRPLAGDASARRFERLTRNGASAILMDDPGEQGGSSRKFVRIAGWLHQGGYSAPQILAADPGTGLVLAEDLGDALFARLCQTDVSLEPELYGAAAGFLADMQKRPPPPGLAALDGRGLAGLTALLADWYCPAANAPGTTAVAAIGAAIVESWDRLRDRRLVTSLRDFHAENLIWLPDRTGVARVGLLDFQDAVLAHPAYDLVSLLQDARRDVPAGLERDTIARFVAASGVDAEGFEPAYALMGAQRALRILAVCARLALRDGKARYADLMPRVWGYLQRNLAHPALAGLQAAVAGLPPPDQTLLDRLVAEAGRHPQAAMVFAAGFGTRMGALTADRPKPLVPVAGRALIDHALDLPRGADVGRVVVNLHYRGDMIRTHLAGQPGIAFSDESDEILETGGGLRKALPLLGPGPVFALNSDAVWRGPAPFALLRAGWHPDRMDALLLLVPLSRAHGHRGTGDFTVQGDGRLTRAGEMVYTGAQIIAGETVAAEPDAKFSLNRVWDRIAKAGRLHGVVYPGDWCDVGHPEAIALAETLVSRRPRPEAHAF